MFTSFIHFQSILFYFTYRRSIIQFYISLITLANFPDNFDCKAIGEGLISETIRLFRIFESNQNQFQNYPEQAHTAASCIRVSRFNYRLRGYIGHVDHKTIIYNPSLEEAGFKAAKLEDTTAGHQSPVHTGDQPVCYSKHMLNIYYVALFPVQNKLFAG